MIGARSLRRQPGLCRLSYPDTRETWTGLDVDLCRAILGGESSNDASKVKFVPYSPRTASTALHQRLDVW